MKKSIVGLLMLVLLVPAFSFATTTTPTTAASEQTQVDQRQELMLQLISLLRTYISQLQQQLALKAVTGAPIVLGVSTSTASSTEQTETPKKRRGGGGGGGSRNNSTTPPNTETSTTTVPTTIRVELTSDDNSNDIYDLRDSKGVYFDFYIQPFGTDVVPQTLVFTVETPGATTTDIIDEVILDGNRGTLMVSNSYDSATYMVDTQNLIGILDNQRQRLGVSVLFEDLNITHTNQTVRIKAGEEEKVLWKILSAGSPIQVSSIKNNLLSGTFQISYSPIVEDVYWNSEYAGIGTADERLIFTMDADTVAVWDDFKVPVTPACIKFINFCVSTSTAFTVMGHDFSLTGPEGFSATTTINWDSRNVDISIPSPYFTVSEGRSVGSEFSFNVQPSLPGEYVITFLGAELETQEGLSIGAIVTGDEEDRSMSTVYPRP